MVALPKRPLINLRNEAFDVLWCGKESSTQELGTVVLTDESDNLPLNGGGFPKLSTQVARQFALFIVHVPSAVSVTDVPSALIGVVRVLVDCLMLKLGMRVPDRKFQFVLGQCAWRLWV